MVVLGVRRERDTVTGCRETWPLLILAMSPKRQAAPEAPATGSIPVRVRTVQAIPAAFQGWAG